MFQILPSYFFMPLACPSRAVYWDCICRLFSIMDKQLSFGIEREILVNELEDYFDQSQAAEFVEEEFTQADSRGKANGVLRKLESYGWIEIETDKSYVQRVNFKEYSVKVLKTLLDIEQGKRVEYQGYIYAIYSLVHDKTDQPGVVLMQVVENTELLFTGLKNLNSNIKHYIDNLTRHQSVPQIMDALFNDYMSNIVDKAYHRLRTSDNVAKFRPEIIERLEKKSKRKDYIEQTAREIAAIKEISMEEAKELVYLWLHNVIEVFRNMDDILNEIDQKNTQYQRAAINRAKFLMTGNEDVRGQLKEILLGLNERINEEHLDLAGIYELEFMDGLIRLYSSYFLDTSSLYSPGEGKKEFQPQKVGKTEPDFQFRQEKMQKMMQKMQKILNPEKIDRYIAEQLQGRKQMNASELPLQTMEDFVKLIYVRLYGQRKNMCYQVEVGQEVQYNGFHFKDFIIRRK